MRYPPRVAGSFSIVALFVALTASSAQAGAAEPGVPGAPSTAYGSVDWQKVSLETQLTDRVRHAIGTVLPERSFLVNSSVQIGIVRVKSARSAKIAGGDNSLLPLGKLNIDALPPPDNPSQTVPELSVFDRIQSATVSIFVDRSVSTERRQLISKLTESIADSIVGEGKTDVHVERIDLAPDPEHAAWDARRWFEELKLPLSLGLIALLLIGFGAWVFQAHRKLELRKLELLESQLETRGPARVGAAQAAPVEDGAARTGITGPAVPGGTPSGAIEGFRVILRENPARARSLMRQWIRLSLPGAAEALLVLPFTMPMPELLALIRELSPEERSLWLRQLSLSPGGASDPSTVARAQAFIASQIVESLLGPEPMADAGLHEKLLQLSAEDCAGIISEEPALGAVMLGLLPSAQVARVYELLDPTVAHELAQAGADTGTQGARLQALLKMVDDRAGSRETSPLLEKSAELLKSVGPEKEKSIFELLVESEQYELLESASRRFFPAELIEKLPDPLLRAALQRIDPRRQAEIFCAQPQWLPRFLTSLGGPEAKPRVALEIELERLKADAKRTARCQKNRAALGQYLVQLVRNVVREDPGFEENAQEIVSAWLHEKTSGRRGAA